MITGRNIQFCYIIQSAQSQQTEIIIIPNPLWWNTLLFLTRDVKGHENKHEIFTNLNNSKI